MKRRQKQVKQSKNKRATIASSKYGIAIKDKAIRITTKNKNTLTYSNTIADYNISNVNKSAPNRKINSKKALAKEGDKATKDIDISTHTIVGLLLATTNSNIGSNNRTDKDDSLLLADPNQNAAKEILDNVSNKLGKSGKAILQG